tara:strand:+ start:98590 stop:98769 length:180 start_codon:yes stop_codon:yes gene_type:complete
MHKLKKESAERLKKSPCSKEARSWAWFFLVGFAQLSASHRFFSLYRKNEELPEVLTGLV